MSKYIVSKESSFYVIGTPDAQMNDYAKIIAFWRSQTATPGAIQLNYSADGTEDVDDDTDIAGFGLYALYAAVTVVGVSAIFLFLYSYVALYLGIAITGLISLYVLLRHCNVQRKVTYLKDVVNSVFGVEYVERKLELLQNVVRVSGPKGCYIRPSVQAIGDKEFFAMHADTGGDLIDAYLKRTEVNIIDEKLKCELITPENRELAMVQLKWLADGDVRTEIYTHEVQAAAVAKAEERERLEAIKLATEEANRSLIDFIKEDIDTIERLGDI